MAVYYQSSRSDQELSRSIPTQFKFRESFDTKLSLNHLQIETRFAIQPMQG
jgi:hypothetical protein